MKPSNLRIRVFDLELGVYITDWHDSMDAIDITTADGNWYISAGAVELTDERYDIELKCL